MASEMFIHKSVVVNKPLKDVFAYLKYTRNQDAFSVWNMTDPNRKTTSQGKDGTVGFIYSWDSTNKNVGAGSQEIKNIVEGEKIEYELRFERPMKNIAQSKFALKKINENQTEVTWDFKGPTKFPMSLFKSIFQKILGKDITKSLENLKSVLEN
ncbi:MAG: SRPBCC family protein [Bacteroidia bacterium]